MATISFEHAEEARDALREIVSYSGSDTLSDPRAMSNLLKDLLPDDPRTARLFVAADRQRPALLRAGGGQPQVQLALTRRQLLPRRGLQQLHLRLVMRRAQMPDIPRTPRCEEYTICTAVAPDAVLTVRTYGDTSQL
ncbi:MAG TPA: hypothetical protein VFI65_05145 [Streptosporangiaceae bacterium]|nr:hypothetical protein [Streptosporangiaceae bacterium]